MTNTINWDALGAIGELIGAVAVVATLLYLAIQIRQNNASQRIATKQEMTRQFADFIDMLVLHPGICAIHDRGLAGEELSATDKPIFSRLMAKAAWQCSTMHLQYVVQNMHAGDWQESRSLIAYYCSTPGFQTFWQSRNRAHGPEFLQYIDAEIQRSNASSNKPTTENP
jgi:hypothetical protein